MSVSTLELTAHDPIIARDGRPFGLGQGNRMRGLSWPLPSVVAGSLRSALVKASPNLDFTRATPVELLRVEVAGIFPCSGGQLYLPAPNDCVWEENSGTVFRVGPVPLQEGEGADFPVPDLSPVQLTTDQARDDFKVKAVPAWWPLNKYEQWLTMADAELPATWFDAMFLDAAKRDIRDHICLNAETGTAAEGLIFATEGLTLTHLPRFGSRDSQPSSKRFAEITLSVRVTSAEKVSAYVDQLNIWSPLGGERRLVHWQRSDQLRLWKCPDAVRTVLERATRIRMVLASPAIFDHGWLPAWLDSRSLQGRPLGDGPTLKLVGACISRWRAVSGWAYAPHSELNGRRRVVPEDSPGPKAIRRMVPAGGVYFFEKVDGDARVLASNGWLKPVSDAPHDRRDGFGLAVWGIW
ncbi:MAG: CRISPR-associated protein Cmr3 [Isosphaeraceae bacterium]|jgi:CRISPR-associated protein Cmr3|nr:MAG: CRISPR-associated protein Cmr3 [Isosphaeraceae bacterium]